MAEHDGADDPADIDTTRERRARITAQVRSSCERCRLAPPRPPLSEEAALALAAGHLDEPARTVLAARRRLGHTVPAVGGFTALRRLTDEYLRYTERVARQRPGAARLLLAHRADELGGRLQDLRRAFVHSSAHYPQSVRAVRRARRDGLHLEIEQREALFAALQQTPAPLPAAVAERARGAVLTIAGDRVRRWSERTPAAEAGRRAAAALTRQVPDEDDRFVDRYDTLLFLAGSLRDRIDSSRAWRSEYFAVQRAQLDLDDELTQIAADTVALRGLLAELGAAARSAPAARAGIEARIAALAPVWDQLVDRVAALARIDDLLAHADARLRLVEVAERTAGLDRRIDDLIGRSGTRELSAGNTDFVGDQFDGAVASLDGGVAGPFALLHAELRGDIADLTAPGR